MTFLPFLISLAFIVSFGLISSNVNWSVEVRDLLEVLTNLFKTNIKSK